jgi:hypothetical protein
MLLLVALLVALGTGVPHTVGGGLGHAVQPNDTVLGGPDFVATVDNTVLGGPD